MVRRALMAAMRWSTLVLMLCGCARTSSAPAQTTSAPADVGVEVAETKTIAAPSLPLLLVADVDLPGKPVRFDYQDLDAAKGNLVIAHMNDASVVVVRATDGSVVKEIPNIPTARGVVVASEAGRIFVTSSPNKVVILDSGTFAEIARVDTGSGPDGIAWDPLHRLVGVSDQHDGAASLIADAGTGARKQLALGKETGNIVFDRARGTFFITVEKSAPPDQLVAIDPVAMKATKSIPLPGCEGAHGLRIHGESALVACEGNSKVVRVDLASGALAIAASGADPDVLAIDPGLGWLYVAAESGEVAVFDLGRPGLVSLGREHPGDASHSVAVDPSTHHVFFPLAKGPAGKPVLRIMKPTGT
jgi:YVTN family beta-propeller protein